MTRWRGAVGAAISLMLSAGLLLGATRGGTAFTTDSARAADIAAHPVLLPASPLVDARSHTQAFTNSSHVTIVDFVYTRCPSMCGTLGGVYQRLQSELVRRQLTDRVRLLTVSFDPAWDTPERLRYYEMLMRPDTAVWTIATLRDSADLQRVLRSFGVRVIPDGIGGFEHNAALHVVDRTNRLVRIVPIEVSSLDQRAANGPSAVANDAYDIAISAALAVADSIAHATDGGVARAVVARRPAP